MHKEVKKYLLKELNDFQIKLKKIMEGEEILNNNNSNPPIFEILNISYHEGLIICESLDVLDYICELLDILDDIIDTISPLNVKTLPDYEVGVINKIEDRVEKIKKNIQNNLLTTDEIKKEIKILDEYRNKLSNKYISLIYNL